MCLGLAQFYAADTRIVEASRVSHRAKISSLVTVDAEMQAALGFVKVPDFSQNSFSKSAPVALNTKNIGVFGSLYE